MKSTGPACSITWFMGNSAFINKPFPQSLNLSQACLAFCPSLTHFITSPFYLDKFIALSRLRIMEKREILH